jgi:hypothetical protein
VEVRRWVISGRLLLLLDLNAKAQDNLKIALNDLHQRGSEGS